VTDHTDIEAIAVVGVGGWIITTATETARILQFATPSGRVINLCLAEGLAAHVAHKATELELAAMEHGEMLRDIGLYERG
jgi:hypothetical protein